MGTQFPATLGLGPHSARYTWDLAPPRPRGEHACAIVHIRRSCWLVRSYYDRKLGEGVLSYTNAQVVTAG